MHGASSVIPLILVTQAHVKDGRPTADAQERLAERALQGSCAQRGYSSRDLHGTVFRKSSSIPQRSCNCGGCRGCARVPKNGDRGKRAYPRRLEAQPAAQFRLEYWPGCPECGSMFGRLLQGIKDAGYLRGAFLEDRTVTVELKEKILFGQIASPSRLPLMWKVDDGLTFTLNTTGATTNVSVRGLSLWGSAQAFGMYQEVLHEEKLNGTECVGTLEDWACVQDEIAAAGKYLYNEWDRRIKPDDRKVTRVMKTMYGGAAYWALRAVGKWPTVFYSAIISPPLTFTTFEFSNGMVSATTYPALDHPQYDEYNRLNLFDKSFVLGIKNLFNYPKGFMDVALAEAKSGMNLAMMMSFGNPMVREEMIRMGIRAADAVKVGNIMAWCAGSPPGSDPLCHGRTPGRVAWGPGIPPTMDTTTTTMPPNMGGREAASAQASVEASLPQSEPRLAPPDSKPVQDCCEYCDEPPAGTAKKPAAARAETEPEAVSVSDVDGTEEDSSSDPRSFRSAEGEQPADAEDEWSFRTALSHSDESADPDTGYTQAAPSERHGRIETLRGRPQPSPPPPRLWRRPWTALQDAFGFRTAQSHTDSDVGYPDTGVDGVDPEATARELMRLRLAAASDSRNPERDELPRSDSADASPVPDVQAEGGFRFFSRLFVRSTAARISREEAVDVLATAAAFLGLLSGSGIVLAAHRLRHHRRRVRLESFSAS